MSEFDDSFHANHDEDGSSNGAGSWPVGSDGASVADKPNQNWSIEQLQQYGIRAISQATALDAAIVRMKKKGARHVYRAGHAFSLIRAKLKEERQYMKWLETFTLSHSAVHQAIQLYERFESEEAVGDMTTTEAKAAVGIVQAKNRHVPGRMKPAKRSKPARNTPDNAGSATCEAKVSENDAPDQPQERQEEAPAGIDLLTGLHQFGVLLESWTDPIVVGQIDDIDNHLNAIQVVESKLEELKNAIKEAS